MKKLLFIMDTFPLGGISKSLLALFNEIEGQYDIDFLLMQKEGLFVPLIPKSINILPCVLEPEFRNPHPKNIICNFGTMKFSRWLLWLEYSMRCTLSKLTGGLKKMVCTMDEFIGKHSRPLGHHYDAAIAYQGGRCIYYLVENVYADIKIGYVHSNYSVNQTDYMLKPSDIKYFPQLDYIVTISQICLKSLYNEFPTIKDRCLMIENICSPKMIKAMAQKGDTYEDKYSGVRLVSMGRFDIHIKGMDIAIKACRILKSAGINFHWYWLGEGEQRNQLESMIREAGVQDVFILLGAKTNPYNYIKDADIYIQPSRIEGKSVALDEVKALAKPIVVTNFKSVLDQFTNRQNALICDIDAKSLSDSIIELLNNKELRDSLVNNLKQEKVGNEEQAEIFESLLNNRHI